MTVRQGPQTDRWLMRAKDFIIIVTALIALVKWFYLNPIQMEGRVETQERLLGSIVSEVRQQGEVLGRIDERLQGIERAMRRRTE